MFILNKKSGMITECNNADVIKTCKKDANYEVKAHLLYRIDIWHNASTSMFALDVDKAIAPLGLRRIACADVDDPSGLKHKVMRYEGIIDVDTEIVYQ